MGASFLLSICPACWRRVSISPSIATISGAFGSTARTASHSCMASEKEPTLKYASARRREVSERLLGFPELCGTRP